MDKVLAKVDKKQVRLGVHWNSLWLNFCSFGFSGDNSFYFSSKFHSKGQLQLGQAVLKDNHLFDQEPDQFHSVEKGFHVSLHPKGKFMHVKDNQAKKILYKREIDWYPVNRPFNLLILYTPPLETCKSEKDKSDFYTQVPDHYKDSIQIRVDIFPRETKEHHPFISSIWIFWGRCPVYLIRVSMNLIKTRTPALLYWPADEDLRL
ncbi:MAG: hypothetical protein A3A81_07140 [Omnitrophica bacterium RIFCSPLOWO2_01_FULL_45_10b]|nr:MAG: hypothetical protein A3A81_07140 [Omnitrophica bacterium RIFCSPLOWO2_01_FULL_45_10b]